MGRTVAARRAAEEGPAQARRAARADLGGRCRRRGRPAAERPARHVVVVFPRLERHRLRRRFRADEAVARRARSVRRASAPQEREPRPVVLRPAVGGRLPALRAAGARRLPFRREGAGVGDRRGDPRPPRRTVGTEPDLPRRRARDPRIRAAMPRRARPESRRARVPVLAAARPVACRTGRADRPADRVLRGAPAARAGSRRPALRDRDP